MLAFEGEALERDAEYLREIALILQSYQPPESTMDSIRNKDLSPQAQLFALRLAQAMDQVRAADELKEKRTAVH